MLGEGKQLDSKDNGSDQVRKRLEQLPGIQTLLSVGSLLLFRSITHPAIKSLPLGHITGHEHGHGSTCLSIQDWRVEVMQHMGREEAQCTWREVDADLGLSEADLQLGVVTIAEDTSKALQIVTPVSVRQTVCLALLIDGNGREAGCPEEGTTGLVVVGAANLHVMVCMLRKAFKELPVAVLSESTDMLVAQELDHGAVVVDKGQVVVG